MNLKKLILFLIFSALILSCKTKDYVVLKVYGGKNRVLYVKNNEVCYMDPHCEEYYPRPFFESGEFNENYNKLDSMRFVWYYENWDRTGIEKGIMQFKKFIKDDDRDTIFYNCNDVYSRKYWFRYRGDTLIQIENCTRDGFVFEIFEAVVPTVPVNVCKDCLIGEYVLDKKSFLPLLINIENGKQTYATHYFEDRNFIKKIEENAQDSYVNDSISIHWNYYESKMLN